MSKTVFLVSLFLVLPAVSFSSVPMVEVDDWVDRTFTPARLKSIMATRGYTQEEIKEAFFAYALQVEGDAVRGDHGFRRGNAIRAISIVGTTNDIDRILPFVGNENFIVHASAISSCIVLKSAEDWPGMFQFADYTLNLPEEESSRHVRALFEFGWIAKEPATPPELRNAIVGYFWKNMNRDYSCADLIDWELLDIVPGYETSEERRKLAAAWAVDPVTKAETRFRGVQRQFFPEDVPPDGEVPPPAQTNGQEIVRELVEPMPNGSVAGGTIEAVDSTAGAESLRTSNSKSWFALLGILLVFGLVVGLRGRQSSGMPK